MYYSNMDGATKPAATPPETTSPSAATPPAAAATTPASAAPPSPPATGKPQGSKLPTVTMMPTDFTHVGQAKVLKGYAEDILQYTDSTSWLTYNGSYYESSG